MFLCFLENCCRLRHAPPGIEQPSRLGSLKYPMQEFKGICNLEAVIASVRIRGASPSVYTFVISLRLLMSLLSKTNATGPARIFRIAPDAASPLHWECPEYLRSSMRWSAEPSSIWHRYRSAAAQENTAEPLQTGCARLTQERQKHHQTEAMQP